jgi:hypothetical protein
MIRFGEKDSVQRNKYCPKKQTLSLYHEKQLFSEGIYVNLGIQKHCLWVFFPPSPLPKHNLEQQNKKIN